jgi:hypothetical protein
MLLLKFRQIIPKLVTGMLFPDDGVTRSVSHQLIALPFVFALQEPHENV